LLESSLLESSLLGVWLRLEAATPRAAESCRLARGTGKRRLPLWGLAVFFSDMLMADGVNKQSADRQTDRQSNQPINQSINQQEGTVKRSLQTDCKSD
jgi:hypothetical protein